MEAWRIFNDGERVIIEFDGKTAKSVPWEHALEVANAIKSNAKLCEQYAKANQIIHDAAILARTGIPVGLTSDPRMQDEARKESQFNREIRRSNLPGIGSVASQEVFGTPAVRNSPSLEQLRSLSWPNSKT